MERFAVPGCFIYPTLAEIPFKNALYACFVVKFPVWSHYRKEHKRERGFRPGIVNIIANGIHYHLIDRKGVQMSRFMLVERNRFFLPVDALQHQICYIYFPDSGKRC